MQTKAVALAALAVMLGLLGAADLVDAQAGVPVIPVTGCFTDDPMSPSFTVTPGILLSNSPVPCITQCGALNYPYAMVQKTACFCGNSTATLTSTPSSCNYTCDAANTTGYAGPCGGSRGAATIFNTISLVVDGLNLTVSPLKAATENSPVSVKVGVKTDPTLLRVKLNQGDGSEPYVVSPNNSTYSLQYRVPGNYIVAAQAVFATLNGKPSLARTKISVYDDHTKNSPTADCNDTLIELQKPFACIVTVNRGPSQTAVADGIGVRVAGPSGLTENSLLSGVRISDIFGQTYGTEPSPFLPYPSADFTFRNTTEALVPLGSLPTMAVSGVMNVTTGVQILAARANIWAQSTSDKVTFDVVRPVCAAGSVYCLYTRKCETDCSRNCSSATFIVNEERCKPGTSTSTNPTSFTTVAAIGTYTASRTGFLVAETAVPSTASAVDSKAGDVLIRATCTNCVIISRKARLGEKSANDTMPLVAAHVYERAGYTIPARCPAGPISTAYNFAVGTFSSAVFTSTAAAPKQPGFDCQDPVVRMNATTDKFFYRVNETVTLTITMERGAPVNATYTTNGATTPVAIFNYSAPRPYTFSYPTSGVYDIVVKASNLWTLNRGHDFDNVTALVAIQYPVTTNWVFSVLKQDEYILPANVTFLMTFSGANLPTNATAIVDFGDGSPFLNLTVNSKNFTVDHYYEYQDAQANYSTFINMSNDVDAQSFMVSYKGVQGPFELFKPIKNLTLDCAYFVPGVPGRREGGGIEGLDFPTDFNVTCFIKLDQGIVEYFELLYVNDSKPFKNVTVADRIHTDGYNFTLYYPQEGYFNITVRGYNSLETYVYSDEHYLLHMISDVRNVTMDDFLLITSPNRVKQFDVLFDSTGGTSCLFIIWGDKSLGNTYGDEGMCSSITSDLATFEEATIVSPFRVNHTYSYEGVYTIKATAWNVKSMDDFTMDVTIVDLLGLECYKPKVTIVQPPAGHIYIRSKPIYLSGEFSLNCSGILTFNLTWSITEISNDSLRAVIRKFDQIATQLPTWNQNQLTIPALFLTPGKYEIGLTVRMTGKAFFERWPVQNTFFADVQVWPSPLEVLIAPDGASKKSFAKDAIVNLQAVDNSLDPDDPKATQPIAFEWLCAHTSETLDPAANFTTSLLIPATKPASGTGCFGAGPGKLNVSTSGILTFKAESFMKAPDTYQVYAIGKKDNRSSYNKLEVEVLNISSPIPDVAIECIVPSNCLAESTANGLLMLAASDRLPFSAVCNSGCSDAKTMTYTWSAKIKNAAGAYVSVPWTSTLAPFGTTKNELLLDTGYLTYLATNSPTMSFTLRLDVNLDTGKFGFTEKKMAVVRAPIGGKCKCTVANMPPVALKDPFTCTCSGWVDPQQKKIVSYSYYSLDSSSPPNRAEQGSSALGGSTLYLSPGATLVRCAIANELGAMADVAVDIYSPANATTPIAAGSMSVQAPSAQDVQEIMANPLTAKLLAENPALSALLATVAAAALMSAPDTAINLNTMSAAEVIDKLDLVSETMTTALTAQAKTSIETPADAVKSASLLATLTGSMTPSDPRSLSVSLDSLAAVTEIATSIKTVVSGSDPAPSMAQLSQIAGSMLSASAGLGPSLLELKDKGGDCSKEPAVDLRFCRTADNKMKTVDLASPPADVNKVEPSDPAIIMCCAQAETRTYASAAALQAMQSAVKAAGAAIAAQLTAGEVKTITTATGAAMTITRKTPAELAASPLIITPKVGSPVSITFPKDLPCLPAGCNAPLPVVAGAMPKNMLTGPNIQGQRIDNNNQVVMCDIPGMAVENLKTPIVLKAAVSSATEKSGPVFSMRNFQAELVNSTIPIVYTVVAIANNSGEKVAATLQFDRDVSSLNLALIARRAKYPVPISGQFDANNSFLLKTKTATSDGTYSLECDIDPKETGNLIFGLFEITSSSLDLTQLAKKATWDNYKTFINQKLNISFTLKPILMAASYFDEKLKQWSGSGVKVCGYTPGESAKLCTNHLSTFASGFFVKPNLVDFSYVFANAGFSDNLTIYLTLILTISVYVLLVVWARIKDKRDRQHIGALPLPDNDPQDKYIYEVLVQTGDKNSADTDSKVQFILSGEADETEVRTLADPRKSPRKVFGRGALDAFVLACPRPLGHLNFLRIWHDSSGVGERQSWFLSYVAVRDVQTGTVYEFICNNWLAVEKADGLIDRLIPVAGEPDKKNFSFLFNTTSSRNLRDNHLWFSVFMRPPRSRFTRVQRISSCMALLYLSMLTNAMFYGVLPDKPGAGALKFGPFALSPEQIGVGLMSTLICFPPTILIIQLFRKSRPRHLRKSRITEALAKDGRMPDPSKTGKIPRKKKFTFPWWCRIVAWLLVATCFCVSVFFIWAYGIQFGNEKATKWVSSLIFSFFSSILLVEPIKILALAAVFSLICKDADTESDDADEDEEDPHLEWDESYLQHAQAKKSDGLASKAPKIDPELIEAARRKRMNEIKMWSMIKELIFYSMYLWIVVILSYGDQDPNGNLMQRTLRRSFTRPGTGRIKFQDIETTDDWWNWTQNVLLQELRSQNWYNGKPAFGLSGFLNDRSNRVMGYGIIRQVRVRPETCKVPHKMYPFMSHCAGYPNMKDEDEANYCPGWKPLEEGCDKPEYFFKDWSELEAFPWIGELDMYSGGGYVIPLSGRQSDILNRLEELKNENWVDRLTRALFVEFSIYNAQVNLFAVVRLSSEMIPGGGFTSQMRADIFRLMPHYEGFGLFVLICEIAFVVFTLYFTVQVVKGLCKERLGYFKVYWNLTELAQIILSYVAIGSYLVRMKMTGTILEHFVATKGNAYTRLDKVMAVQEVYSQTVAGLCFMAMILFLKLMRFNKTIKGFSLMFKKCWDDLIGFGFIFLILFLAFAMMFYVFFFQLLLEWHTFLGAAGTSFSIMLGKFDFSEIRETNIAAAVLFFVFNIMMSIIMLNLMLAIIIMAFQEVEKEMLKMTIEREFEIVPFLMARARAFFGLSAATAPIGQVSKDAEKNARKARAKLINDEGKVNESDVQQFPRKIDQMLDYVNNIYFDGGVDIHNKEWLKQFKKKTRQGKTDVSWDKLD